MQISGPSLLIAAQAPKAATPQSAATAQSKKTEFAPLLAASKPAAAPVAEMKTQAYAQTPTASQVRPQRPGSTVDITV